MLPRAAAEAVIALLLGGTLATMGWAGLLRPWDWAVPYLAGFLALELLLNRRGGGAAKVFVLGAAFAFVYEGVYTKSVLDGLGILGIETGALAAACFDWGMLAVMAAHLVSRRFPRSSAEPSAAGTVPAAGILGVLVFCMGIVYLVKTAFGHYIAANAVAPSWLVTDILLVAAAWVLGKRALSNEDPVPPRWAYVLCAFAVCAPLMQAFFTWADQFRWPGPLTFMLGAFWVAGCAIGFRNLWQGRHSVDAAPVSGSNLVVYAAVWRIAGSMAILLAYHPAVFDERAAAAYAVLVDLPSRAMFSYAFLTSRLDV